MGKINLEKTDKNSKLSKFLKSMIEVGIIGFGGGSALIPIIEKEIVEKNKLISSDEYVKHVVISNITPGGLPPKLGMAIGYDVAGNLGMLLGSFLIAFPGTLATIILLSFISLLGDNVIKQIGFASVGISAFIIFLLLQYIFKVQETSKENDFSKSSYILIFISFALTSGKEIRQMISMILGCLTKCLGVPIFDISTINLLVISFFIIFFNNGKFYKNRAIVSTIVAILYLFSIGKAKIISIEVLPNILLCIMFFLSVIYTIKDVKIQNLNKKIKIKIKIKETIKKIAYIIGITLIIAIPCILLITDSLDFTLNAILSVVTSFGGGESYLTVADGILVNNGYVSREIFYGQIIPIANALPGSILFKLLSGIGYFFGLKSCGILGGYLMSLYSFILGLAATGIVFVFVQAIYNAFSDLKVFTTLKHWMQPIICGMLLTTILSMIIEALKIMLSVNINALFGLLFIILIISTIFILHKKYKVHDIILILCLGTFTICALNLIYFFSTSVIV